MRPVAVDGVITKGSKILLIKRAIEPYKDFWVLPGGHVEYDETVEEAVVRELKEETSMDTEIVSLIGVFSNPNRDPRQTISIAFLLRLVSDAQIKLNFEASSFGWFNIDALPENIGFDHVIILDKAKEIMFK